LFTDTKQKQPIRIELTAHQSTLRSYIIDIDRSEFVRTVPAREFIKTAFGSDESS